MMRTIYSSIEVRERSLIGLRLRLTESKPAAPTPDIPRPISSMGMLLAPVLMAAPTKKTRSETSIDQNRPKISAIEAQIGRKTVDPKT
jgi:hypothetical protein